MPGALFVLRISFARLVSKSLTYIEEFLVAGIAMRDVFPIGVVYETIECCGAFREGPNDFQAWTAVAGGVRIVLQNRALDVRLYAIPALFRGFRSIHRGPLCHEREFHVQRNLFVRGAATYSAG